MQRRRLIPRFLVGAALVAVLAMAGCDSGDDTASTTTTTKTVTLRKQESSDPLPKLERGWVVVRSRSGGFALGRPPGWEPSHSGRSLTLLAPDRLVAVTVSADRSPSGLAIPAARYVSRAASSLKGYEGKLKPSKPRTFDQRYSGAQVVERGRTKSGVPQRLRVIVLRRDRLVTFTVVIAQNDKRSDAAEAKQALEIVDTVRSLAKDKPTPKPEPLIEKKGKGAKKDSGKKSSAKKDG